MRFSYLFIGVIWLGFARLTVAEDTKPTIPAPDVPKIKDIKPKCCGPTGGSDPIERTPDPCLLDFHLPGCEIKVWNYKPDKASKPFT